MRRISAGLVSIALACGMVMCAFGLSACGSAVSTSAVSSSSSVSNAPYDLVSEGTLTVATCAENPPMEYADGSNPTGFDIALITEVANRLGLSLSIEDVHFDSLIAQVANGGSFDCAISSIEVNEQRAQEILFTNPYLDSSLAVLVPATSTAAGIEELAALPVGAIRASAGENWAAENLPAAPYTPFQQVSDMLDALHSGAISVAVCDWATAAYSMESEKADYKVLAIIPTGKQYAIAVNAANPGLADAINETLADMEADGTITALKAQWFGEAAEKIG